MARMARPVKKAEANHQPSRGARVVVDALPDRENRSADTRGQNGIDGEESAHDGEPRGEKQKPNPCKGGTKTQRFAAGGKAGEDKSMKAKGRDKASAGGADAESLVA